MVNYTFMDSLVLDILIWVVFTHNHCRVLKIALQRIQIAVVSTRALRSLNDDNYDQEVTRDYVVYCPT